MSLMRPLTRSKPEPAASSALLVEISDPSTGEIRRRFLRRKLANVIAIGPSAPPEAPAQAPPQMADAPVFIEHQGVVGRELQEIDKHRAAVEARLAVLGAGSFEAQELAAELGALATLRAEFMADLDKPITRGRDGSPLDDRMRAFIRARTKELREQSWRSAEMAQREGHHRRARRLRHDSLRARHIAEHELQLRPSLRGYSFAG